MRQVITFTMKPEDYRAMRDVASSIDESGASFIKTAIAERMKRLAKKIRPIGRVGEMQISENNQE